MSSPSDSHAGEPGTGAQTIQEQLDRVMRERNRYARTLADANRVYDEKLRELSALQRVSTILRNVQSVKQVCSGIVDTMVEEVGAQNCSLMLLDRVHGHLTIRAARGRADAEARYFDADAAPPSFPLGEGVAGWVAQHGEPVVIPDVGADERFKPLEVPESSVRSLLCLPLVESDQVWGVLNLSHPDINAFTEENERILSIVAGQAAIALANVQLFDELHRMNEALEGTVTQRTSEVRQKAGQLAVINRIAKTVNAAIDPMEALAEITGEIHRLVSFDRFSVALVSSGNDQLRVLTIGPEGDQTQSQEVSLPTGNSISDVALGQGQSFVFGEAEAWGPELTGSEAVAGGMVVPLVFQEQVRGLIVLTRLTGEAYAQTDLHLIEDLAEHIAVALEKSRLYKALVKMNEELEEIVDARTRQLAESEVHYRTIFEQSGDGILLTDDTGNVREANERCRKLFGCDLDGMGSLALVREDDDAELSLTRLVADTSESGQTLTRVKLIRPDGEVRYVELDLNPVVLLNRAHVLGVAHDITGRRRLEEQLLRSEKLAAMGTLAASVAHEINNPLEGIKNCINVLQRKVPDAAPEREIIDQINKGFIRIRDIVRQILDFHRPGTEVQTVLDLNETLTEVLRLFQNELRNRQIVLNVELADRLPCVQGSAGRIQQVLTNIIVNAADAIQGPGTLSVRTARQNGEVFMEFVDTGCGIAPKDLEAIFEPFFTNKRSGSGTGLGLWISHSVIKEHGGRIEVASEVGKGTTVTVFLPVMDAPTGEDG